MAIIGMSATLMEERRPPDSWSDVEPFRGTSLMPLSDRKVCKAVSEVSAAVVVTVPKVPAHGTMKMFQIGEFILPKRKADISRQIVIAAHCSALHWQEVSLNRRPNDAACA